MTEWALAHPWMTLLIVLLLLLIIDLARYSVDRVLIRYFRARNIYKHGWPPSHLDADGDFKTGEST